MRALIVDDDAAIRAILARRLGRRVQVHEASGVRDAEAKLREMYFDVVVSDERMADGTGSALLGLVRVDFPTCRRALMSGADVGATTLGISYERFFRKPEGLTELVAWLSSLAEGTAFP